MAYIGQVPATGENNSFKILDDISSYTLTFDGSSASVVSVADDTITQNNHRFITGQRVTYTDGTGTAIGGLTDGTVYYIIKNDQNTIKYQTVDYSKVVPLLTAALQEALAEIETLKGRLDAAGL